MDDDKIYYYMLNFLSYGCINMDKNIDRLLLLHGCINNKYGDHYSTAYSYFGRLTYNKTIIENNSVLEYFSVNWLFDKKAPKQQTGKFFRNDVG